MVVVNVAVGCKSFGFAYISRRWSTTDETRLNSSASCLGWSLVDKFRDIFCAQIQVCLGKTTLLIAATRARTLIEIFREPFLLIAVTVKTKQLCGKKKIVLRTLRSETLLRRWVTQTLP